jgi:hypothetical protein
MPSELERRLGALYSPAPPIDAAHREDLRGQLLARPELVSAASRSRRRWSGWWLGGVLSAAALAGACVLPVEYEMPMGQHVTITLEGDDAVLAVDEHGDADALDPRALSAFVEARFDAQRIELSIAKTEHRDANGHVAQQLRIDLVAFGADGMPDGLADEIVDAFPVLERADVESEPVDAVVEGTLGGKLGHAWLDVVIDEHGVEEARRRILADLKARGVAGDAQVEIVDEPGRREVKVRVEAETPPGG